MAGDIPNGMLCYTGLTPGSTATYFCDNGSSGVLECKPNGAWNRTVLECLSKQHVCVSPYLPFISVYVLSEVHMCMLRVYLLVQVQTVYCHKPSE